LQTLNTQTIRNDGPKRVKRLVGLILASSVAVLLVAELYSNGAKWTAVPSIAKKAAPRPEQTQAAQEEEEQRIGDFMQKVARAHVGRLDPLEQVEEQTDRPESASERIDSKASAPAPLRKSASVGKSERPRIAALAQKPAAAAAAPVEAPAVPPAEAKDAQPSASLTSRVIDSVTGAVTSQNKRIMDGFGYIANAVGSLAKK